MVRGQSLARKLRNIVIPLKNWLTTQKTFRLPGLDSSGKKLPPPLEVCRMRGEALLVTEFYSYVNKAGIDKAEYQLALWEKLLCQHTLQDLAQRIGLISNFTNLSKHKPTKAAFTAWCILVDSLASQCEKDLLHIATVDVFRHFFIGLYPKSNNKNHRSPSGLRMKATNGLRKTWGIGTQLKESFTTSESQCEFTLKFKAPGYQWQTLLTVTGSRLKPTRIKAYTRLIDEIKQGLHKPVKG